MIEEVRNELPEVFLPRDVIRKVKAKYPQVPDATIRTDVFGLTPNHSSSKHYSQRRKMFYYLGSGRFRNLGETEAETITTVAENEEDVDRSFTFSLESDLEDHLVGNLEQIEEDLRLYEEDGERTGKQYVTDVGRIDILAVDKSGDYVVIELKREASDKSCGQLLRYMGWVKRHIAGNRNVKGIIITRRADDELKYAASAVGNVKIKEYEVEFTFNDADLRIE